jgi:hypothetical protein
VMSLPIQRRQGGAQNAVDNGERHQNERRERRRHDVFESHNASALERHLENQHGIGAPRDP